MNAVGFGTYPLQGEVCKKAVQTAVAVGYRIIDTATFYHNLEEVREGVRGVGRERCFLISKVWPDSQSRDLLIKDFEKTLLALQTDFLDCYLLHWPNSTIRIEETLSVMQSFREKGRLRQIGLSNVTINHLGRALEVGVPIDCVQVEMHPFFYDPSLLSFCQRYSIAVQAWSPMARGRVVGDFLLQKIGAKYGKSETQVALRWLLQKGVLPLPGSSNPDHIRMNFEIFDFLLTPEEINDIDLRAASGKRYRLALSRGLGFSDEFDFTYEQCWPKK